MFYVFIYTALCVIYLLALERGSLKPQLHGGAAAYRSGGILRSGWGKIITAPSCGYKTFLLRVVFEVVAGCIAESKREESDLILSEMKDENAIMLIKQVCGNATPYYKICQDG